MQYFRTKNFLKSLKKANQSGGPAKRASGRIKQMLGNITINEEKPFDGFKITNNGENRIKGGKKFFLDGNYRLVIQELGDITIFVYFGNHDDTERFLDNHKGHLFAYDAKNRELIKTYKSEPETSEQIVNLEPSDAEGVIWDILPEIFDEIATGLPPKAIRELTQIEIGEDEEFFKTLPYNLMSSSSNISESQIWTLADALKCVNSGDVAAAHNRVALWKKELKEIDEKLSLDEIQILDTEEIKKISNIDKEFEQELDLYLNHPDPIEWFMFTHPEQQKIVEADCPGGAKLSGVSGSGKTSVLIKRACYLVKKNLSAQVLIVTLNQSLALLIENICSHLLNDEELERTLILPYYDVCRNILREFEPNTDKNYREISTGLTEHYDEVFREYYRCEANNYDARCMLEVHKSLIQRGLDAETYIRQEFDWVRSFITPSNHKNYLTIERKGRGLPLLESQRKQIIQGIDGWTQKMKFVGVADHAMVTHKVMDFYEDIKPEYDFCLVDEVQDLGTLELSLLRKITKKGPNDLFLVGDVAQSIFAKNLDFKQARINTDITTFQLDLNYRNTKEILQASYEIMYQNLDETLLDAEDFEFLDPKFANRTGEKPLLFSAISLEEEIANSISLAKGLIENREENTSKKVCIIICGFTNLEVRKFAEQLNLSCLHQNFDFKEEHLFVSDLEQAKGFEFDEVIIVNCNDGIVPPIGLPEEEQFRTGLQLYVAMTRAKTRLFLSYSTKCSSWIKKAENLITTSDWGEWLDLEEISRVGIPEKLPEVISESDDGDAAVLNVEGTRFLYSRFAIGVDRRLLDWIEINVPGYSEFRKGKTSIRNKWENLNQLYSDLRRNETTKETPYYFSKEGDAELLELFEKISRNTKPITKNFQIRTIKKRVVKNTIPQNKNPIKFGLIKIKDLNLSPKVKNFLQKNNIQYVKNFENFDKQKILKEPTFNRKLIEEAKSIEKLAEEYSKELLEKKNKIKKQPKPKQQANQRNLYNKLNSNEKNAIWLIQNHGNKLDHIAIKKFTEVNKITLKKLSEYVKNYPSEFTGIQPELSEELIVEEIESSKNRRMSLHKKNTQITTTNTLEPYSAYDDK